MRGQREPQVFCEAAPWSPLRLSRPIAVQRLSTPDCELRDWCLDHARLDHRGRRVEPAFSCSYNSSTLPNPDSIASYHSVGVVIPARNEASRIGEVLAGLDPEVDGLPVVAMVVDDGSSDRTAELARAHGAPVIIHSINL